MKEKAPKESVPVAYEPLPDGALENTHRLLASLIGELDRRIEGKRLKRLTIDYRRPAREFLKENQGQVVAIVAIVSPGSNLTMGLLNPKRADVLIGKRSPEREWGAGTWAVPMGKIEPGDISGEDDSLGHTIAQAADREFSEEIRGGGPGGYEVIAGSFADEDADRIIHVVLKQVSETSPAHKTFTAQTPDAREHSAVGWIELGEIRNIEPLEAGTAFLLREGLEFVRENNERLKASGRYRDNLEDPLPPQSRF